MIELIANRKAKIVHKRLEGHFTDERCNVDEMTDFMILDEGFLAKLKEHGYQPCEWCMWEEEEPDK